MSVTSPCNSGNHSTSGETGGVETEEEEEDAGETTMVLTCEGNITDPNLSTKLECLMHRLQHLTQAGKCWFISKITAENIQCLSALRIDS